MTASALVSASMAACIAFAGGPTADLDVLAVDPFSGQVETLSTGIETPVLGEDDVWPSSDELKTFVGTVGGKVLIGTFAGEGTPARPSAVGPDLYALHAYDPATGDTERMSGGDDRLFAAKPSADLGDGRVVFIGTHADRYALWSTDGTKAGTDRLRGVRPCQVVWFDDDGSELAFFDKIATGEGVAYLKATSSRAPCERKVEKKWSIFMTDGSPTGTHRLTSVPKTSLGATGEGWFLSHSPEAPNTVAVADERFLVRTSGRGSDPKITKYEWKKKLFLKDVRAEFTVATERPRVDGFIVDLYALESREAGPASTYVYVPSTGFLKRLSGPKSPASMVVPTRHGVLVRSRGQAWITDGSARGTKPARWPAGLKSAQSFAVDGFGFVAGRSRGDEQRRVYRITRKGLKDTGLTIDQYFRTSIPIPSSGPTRYLALADRGGMTTVAVDPDGALDIVKAFRFPKGVSIEPERLVFPATGDCRPSP